MTRREFHKSKLAFCALLLVLGCTAWLRYRLLGVAFERDEGEYAYGGQLLLQGVPPYQALYNMKLPGIYFFYALLLSLFGSSHIGVHMGLLVVNLLSILLIYFIGTRIASQLVGVLAAGAFALLSIGAPVQGIFANAEHFVLLFALAGVAALLPALEQKKRYILLLLAGLFFGCGFVVKQHGLLFAVWAIFYFFFMSRARAARQWSFFFKEAGVLAGGMLLPYVLVCFYLFQQGVFEKFWFWTFDYARAYGSQATLAQGWSMLTYQAGRIFSAAPLIWAFVLLGIGAVWTAAYRNSRLFILSFVIFSFLAICPGLYFREHYFILLLPAAALAFGIGTEALAGFSRKGHKNTMAALIVIITVVAFGSSIYRQRQVLFQMTPDEIVRSVYWPNPFVESLKIADFIQKNSSPDDTIAVIGSEPQIYFYAKRRSASGFIYTYALMENHDYALQMQKEMIAEIEQAEPKFLIFVRIPTSWLQKQESHLLIYDWFMNYKKNYQQAGFVEIYANTTAYTWRPNEKWPPSATYWLEILERKR